MKKCLFAITLILVATQCPAIAEPTIQWGVTISSGGTPPPAVRYEPLPPPRQSQVWVRGYWGWDGTDYRWVPGRWERARVGYVYVQPEWIQSPDGWQLRQGGWQGGEGRNRDHDREREDSQRRGQCPPGHRKKGDC
ncbi:MAG: YXWGXW repeat-containing protein [Burkholderiales bacterium]|nr:YXWGXW repeat-containing protein [Burkholderiales bacterium]